MVSLQQLRRFFLNISLSVILVTFIYLGFGTASSWAAISSTDSISQPQIPIATMKQEDKINEVKGKIKEKIGNITGDSKKQAAGKAMQFKAKTLEGLNNSIENPNYKPNSQNCETEDCAREATENVESQVRENWH
ncbi:MAG: hypothetical protein ACK47G_17080 [Pseudanabaena sp.]|jgi:uncharacterized protein YjbJ (UPF0337 family)